MRIVGLDVSLTDTGISLLDTDTGKQETDDFFTDKDASDYTRQDYILHFIAEAIDYGHDANTVIFMEDYAYSKNAGKMFTRAELIGIIKFHARNVWRCPVYMVTPGSLKKFLDCSTTGPRRKPGEPKKKSGAGKALMKQAVYSRYDYLSDNDNRVDAYALARYGSAVLIDHIRLDYLTINPSRKKK